MAKSKEDGAVAAPAGKGASIVIKFAKEKNDDGTAKITAGRKHRYKEVPDPAMGVCIGTLYFSEQTAHKLGNPEELTVTVQS